MTGIDVEDEDFEDKVLQKSEDKPVLVDFWADWCMPCKQLSPILDEVADEMGDKVQIAKVNVDKAENTARKYGVRSIPNVKLFIDGGVADEFVGVKSKGDIVEWVRERI